MDQLFSHFILPVLLKSILDKPSQDVMTTLTSSARNEVQMSSAADDKQTATSHREKQESLRTRIDRQLALFLLTQVLKVFSEGGFVNALIVALMHPNPPKLVNQLIECPPPNAVKPSVAVVRILCRRRAYYRRSISQSSDSETNVNNNSNSNSNSNNSNNNNNNNSNNSNSNNSNSNASAKDNEEREDSSSFQQKRVAFFLYTI
ncbi:hypothetical protein RFI_16432, partial [Reticulomyxa filosa]